MPNISSSDCMELAAKLLSLPDETTETPEGEEQIEEGLMTTFGLDVDGFTKLVEALLPFTYPLKSPFSGELMHTFGEAENAGKTWVSFVKMPFKADSTDTP